MRHIKRLFLSLALTCALGFAGFILYLLGYDHSPLHSAERWVAYLLIWPVFLIQYLGGSDPVYYPARWEPVKTLSWIGLWAYFYALVVFWQGRSRKR